MAVIKAFLFLVCVAAVLSHSTGSVNSRHLFFDKFAALLQNKNPLNSGILSKPSKPAITILIPTLTEIDTPTTTLDPEPEPPIDNEDTDLESPTTEIDTPTAALDEEDEGVDDLDGLDGDVVGGADSEVDDAAAGDAAAGDAAPGDGAEADEIPADARFNSLNVYNANESDDIIKNEIIKLSESDLGDGRVNGATSSERLRAQRIFFNRRPKLSRRQKLRLRKQKQRNQQRRNNNRRSQLNQQQQMRRYRRLLAAYRKQLRERRRLINQINRRRNQRRRRRLMNQLRQQLSRL